jgi:protein-tyrosine phosphatase
MLAKILSGPSEAEQFMRRVTAADPGERAAGTTSATSAAPIGRGYRSALALSLMLLTTSCTHLLKQSVVDTCQATLDSRILNFCVVTPDVLWRGGRPDENGAAWLMQHGVRTIVNLELIRDDRSAFAGARIADADKYQADYFRIYDWQPLSKWSPSLLDNLVAHFLAIASQQPKPIYVHCLFGLDRNGVMVAAYRVLVEGAGTEQAIEEMGRYRPPWFAANAKYIRALVPERRDKIRRQMLLWIPKLKRDAHIVCENGSCVVANG